MLVLSRKKDETIIVKIPGREDIKLTIVKIDNLNKVRVGVEADKEIVILRAELDEKIESEKKAQEQELLLCEQKSTNK